MRVIASVSMIDETAALIYKLSPRTAPDLVLKRLGIATSRRRIEFYTLETLLRELPRVEGAIIECGTYRGATLLGMTHLMVMRGLKPRIYGLDSFEGFPDP